MTPSIHWALDLQTILPPRTWAWVIVALAQDTHLWDSLSNPDLYAEALKIIQDDPRKLTPARLGLLSGKTILDLDALRGLPVSKFPAKIRYQIEKFNPSFDDLSESSNNYLKRTFFTACKVSEGKNAPDIGSWLDGKLLHLLQTSKLVLACLLELVSDPIGLLQYLFERSSQPVEFDTILQAFFCLPQDPVEQLRSLENIVGGISDLKKIDFLRSLARQRPGLTIQLSRGINRQLPAISAIPEDGLFKSLISKKLETDLNQLANHSEDYVSSLLEIIELLKKVQGHASAKLAQHLALCESKISETDPKKSIEAWKNAIRINPKDPQYLAGLLKIFIENNRIQEAKAWLESFRGDSSNPSILLQIAKISLLESHKNAAFEQALTAQSGYLRVPEEFRDDFLLEVSALFENLGAPQEALNALGTITATHPMDADYLAKTSRLQVMAERPGDGLISAICAYAASLLSEFVTPKSFSFQDHQMVYIEALEAREAWSDAFKERSAWMDSHPDPTNEDLVAYAKCALYAKHANISINLLNRAINLGDQNEETYELLGLTYQQLGNPSKATEALAKSCELAPYRYQSWLHLAEVYASNNHPERALETLRSAALAVPDSPEIFLKLGEYSFLNNAPTQAIGPLQKAAILVGLDSSQAEPKTIKKKQKDQDLLISEIACTLANVMQSVGKLNEGQVIIEKSLQKINGGIDHYPTLFATYASILKNNGEFDYSIPILERLLEIFPENPDYTLSLCESLLSVTEQPAGAFQTLPLLSAFLEKIKSPHQVFLAETLMADALYKAGNLEAAKCYYQKSLISPYAKSPNWHQKLTFGLGLVNFAMNEVEAALAAFQDAIRSNSGNLEIIRWLAETYLAVHLYDEAFSAAQQVIQKPPITEEAMQWFIDIAIRIQKQPGTRHDDVIQEAIRVLLRFIHHGTEKSYLWLRLGELHLLDQDVKAAFAAFGRILDLPVITRQDQFTKLTHLFSAGKLLIGKQAYEESITFLEPAALLSAELNGYQSDSELDLEPDNQTVTILSQLEEAYQVTGNIQPSVEILRKIIHLDPNNPEPYIRLAERLYSIELVQEAISCLETANELQPGNIDLYNKIIWIYTQSGDLVSALNLAEKARKTAELSADPSKPVFYRYLAAEIARSIFATGLARNLLDIPISVPANEVEMNIGLLRIELNLEGGLKEISLNELAGLEQFNSLHPRLIAIKNRLRIEKPSPIQADILKEAIGRDSKSPASDQFGDAYGFWQEIAMHRSLAEAALLLGDWHACVSQFNRLIALSPNEPFSNFQFARFLVIRAEYQRFFHQLDMVARAPGDISLQEAAYHLFLASIEKALRRLSDISIDMPPDAIHPADDQVAQLTILHWRERGFLAFQPSSHTIDTFSKQVKTDEDNQALILALIGMSEGETNQVILPSPSHNNNLRLYISLLQEQNRPWEALETICQVYEKAIDPSQGDLTHLPIVNYLLSRLSMRTGGQNRLGIHPISALERALQEYPEEPRWHALLAEILLTLVGPGQESIHLSQARQQLEIAIQLESGFASHHHNLGKIYVNQGQVSLAAECFHKACLLDPKFGEAWLELANIQFLDGKLDEAANCADQAINNASEPIEPIVLRGKIALASGNPRGAQSRAQSALKFSPNNIEAQQLLARSLNALGQSEEAIEIMAKVIPQVEKPLLLEIERSRWLSESSPTQEAVIELRTLTQRYPQEPLFKALLAEVLLKLGQMEPAILSARQALQDSDMGLSAEDQSRLFLILGRYYRENGQLDSAIHQLNQAIDHFPENLEAHLELGRTHQDRRQYAMAVSAYQGAMQVAGSDYRPYYMAGLALKEAKEYQAAEEMLQKAAEKSPENPIVHRQLGAVIALNLVHNRRSTYYPEKTS